MQKIGKTASGSIIVEMSPGEWKQLSKHLRMPEIELSAAIRKYRREHGLSQIEFGKRVGIGRNTVSKIEKGLAKNITVEIQECIISTING